MENNHQSRACYNCSFLIEEEYIFCPNCGQKHRTGRVGLRTIISDFFSNNFHFDTKAIRTITGLLIPGFLTRQYFKGIHKKYNSPVQLFLVLSLIFFTLLSYELGDIDISDFSVTNLVQNRQQRIDLIQGDDKILDSISTENGIVNINFGDNEKIQGDTVNKVREYISFQLLFAKLEIGVDSVKFEDKIFPISDFENFNSKAFVEKEFPDVPFYKKQLYTQGLKLGFEGRSLLRFLMLRLPILILLSLPIFALLQQLLYLRRSFYFVEHMTFLLHFLCFIALVLIPAVIFNFYEHEWLKNILFIGGAVYFIFAIKYFYQQRWGKTILKFFLSSFLGLFAFIFASLFILGLSVMIF